MATLVRTDSNNWKAVIRRKGWPTSAKTFRLKREAESWARHIEDSFICGTYLNIRAPTKILFSDAMERYLKEVTILKTKKTQSSENYRSKILVSYFGRYSLAEITSEIVAKFRDHRLATRRLLNHRNPPPLAPLLDPATVRLELSLLSHLFTTAIREWGAGLTMNPVANVRLPAHSDCRTRRLYPDEERLLRTTFSEYVNPMLGWIFDLALETAMRAGEIRSLEISNVNLARRIAYLADTKNGTERTVPLSRRATECLREAINSDLRPDGCQYIFFGQRRDDGSFDCYRFENAWWKLVRSKLGIKGLRFHDLRHEAISRLVEAGLGDLEVASISGHKSMQMLKRYTHLRAEDLVRKLDRLVRSGNVPMKRLSRTGHVTGELQTLLIESAS